MSLPSRVAILEVGARDGLQNEKSLVQAADKIALINRLQQTGLDRIEVTSFVSPKWVPQMADNAEVMAGITRRLGVRYAVLVPNLQGLSAALSADRALWPDEVVVFASASEAFSQRNINCSVADSLTRFQPVVEQALSLGIRVRAAISCAVCCPYEGEVDVTRVDWLAQALKAMGVQHAGVADTIGGATPKKMQRAFEQVLKHFPLDEVSGHFHDTHNLGLANTLAVLEMGVWQFDASVGGLGGCPYAKGAAGNLATERLVYMLHQMDIDTGVDLPALQALAVDIRSALGKEALPTLPGLSQKS